MPIQLEVGKSYITGKYCYPDVTDGEVVSIVGMVPENVVEYKRGYRFFSESGVLYSRFGVVIGIGKLLFDDDGVLVDAEDGLLTSPDNILEELTPDKPHLCVEKFHREVIDPNNIPENIIASDDDRFCMKLGGVYIDRMGIVRHIYKVYHFTDEETWGPGGGFRFISNDSGYNSDGKERDDGQDSIYDIIYQKI